MAELEYNGYRIVANARQTEDGSGKWVFDAATVYGPDGTKLDVAAPVTEGLTFETEEAAAKACISQAKALIVAGDVD
jgi:hypothetical protein